METEKDEENKYDFDLPEVKDIPKAVKPRVHIAGESTCVSCEG